MDVLTRPLSLALRCGPAEPARQGRHDRRAGRCLAAGNTGARAPVPHLERGRERIAADRERAGGPVRSRATGQRRHRLVGATDVRRRGPRAARGLARAGTAGGNHLWMQISHAGRQAPRYVTGRPLAPSAVQLNLLGNFARPRALTRRRLPVSSAGLRTRRRSPATADSPACRCTGPRLPDQFVPVASHEPAHGRLGRFARQPRPLPARNAACRPQIGGSGLPVALKLNSDDFRKGGFSHEECLQVVAWLNGRASTCSRSRAARTSSATARV